MLALSTILRFDFGIFSESVVFALHDIDLDCQDDPIVRQH
jgi:hypothetical protein